jgi:hypothetical protein
MKKASRVAKAQILTKDGFIKASKNETVHKFMLMLRLNIYAYRVKLALYEDKKISKEGFLFNDDIYNLPLGTLNDKKEVLIDSSILPIFDRYLLTEEMALKGDALTAFVVDHSDMLYERILMNKKAETKMSEEEYLQLFNLAYNDMSDIILNHKVNQLLTADSELNEAAQKTK